MKQCFPKHMKGFVTALTHYQPQSQKQKNHLQLPRSGALFTGRGRCKWFSSIAHYDNSSFISKIFALRNTLRKKSWWAHEAVLALKPN
jgi:hypothetical protein